MTDDRSPDLAIAWKPAPHGAQIIVELVVEQYGGIQAAHHAFVAVPPGCADGVTLKAWAYINPFPPPPPPLTPDERRRKAISEVLMSVRDSHRIGLLTDPEKVVTREIMKALADDFDKADRYEDLE